MGEELPKDVENITPSGSMAVRGNVAADPPSPELIELNRAAEAVIDEALRIESCFEPTNTDDDKIDFYPIARNLTHATKEPGSARESSDVLGIDPRRIMDIDIARAKPWTMIDRHADGTLSGEIIDVTSGALVVTPLTAAEALENAQRIVGALNTTIGDRLHRFEEAGGTLSAPQVDQLVDSHHSITI